MQRRWRRRRRAAAADEKKRRRERRIERRRVSGFIYMGYLCSAANPCHHHGPNCHWPHCPQVPLGGLRHGSQGGKAKPHVVDGLRRGQVSQVHQVRCLLRSL
ncbi:hypothetical protein NMG60_11029282 [Bertholletia excelsa]